MTRVAKTLAEHRRDNTFRSDRHAGMQPSASFEAGEIGEAPEDFGPEALEHWEWLLGVVPQEVIGLHDRFAFISMCEEWQEYQRFQRAAMGYPPDKAMKLSSMALQHHRSWLAMARDYGLTAVSRTKVKAPVKAVEDDDPLTRLHEEAREAG
jgi:hypothetical protein